MEPELESPSLSIPSRLGKYEIVSQLGVGGMAQVYLALHRTSIATKLVVLKHVRAEFADDSHFATMFLDEARVALRLSHRNAIHAYEACSSAGHHYLAMEFLEGKTLSRLLRAVGYEHIPMRLHLWMLSEVLVGLQYVHGLVDYDGTPLSIVHRDVSPSNVFVTRTGQIKLVDFGIASFTGAVARNQDGMLKGKVGYASPEQCLDRSVDARSDLYAVGVMLWEALARRRRLSPESARAILQGRLHYSEIDLDQVRPRFPEALLAIVRKALELDPEYRYQSAADFHRDLTAYLDTLSGPAPGRLAAQLMEQHFGAELAQVRQSIEERTQLGSESSIRLGAPTSIDDEPEPPAAVSRHSEGEHLPKPIPRRGVRAAWALSGGGLMMLAAATWGARGSRVAQRQPTPAAESSFVASQSSARSNPSIPMASRKPVLVSDLPLETPHPAVAAGIGPTRRARPAESSGPLLRPRAPAHAPGPAHRALDTNPVRNVVAPHASIPVSSQAQPAEPGVDLVPLAAQSSTQSLDERDPYLP